MRNELTFAALRGANTRRLPGFRNNKGEIAHAATDGSDWSPAQWLQAMVGEVGEYANLRKKFERGDISEAEFICGAEMELSDIVIYLDLLAKQLGIDLGSAVIKTFNTKSEKVGSEVRL